MRRGKRIDSGEWVYGWLIRDENDGKYYIAKFFGVLDETHEVVPETVGQFIKHLENDRELYEGDVLRSHHFWEGKKEHFLYHEVKWDDEFLCWKAVSINNSEGESIKAHGNPQLFVYLRNTNNTHVVIGSIFDNPELLEAASK